VRVRFPVCSVTESPRLGNFTLDSFLFRNRRAEGLRTNGITDTPHQTNSLWNVRGWSETVVRGGLEIRTKESHERGAGIGIGTVCEPS